MKTVIAIFSVLFFILTGCATVKNLTGCASLKDMEAIQSDVNNIDAKVVQAEGNINVVDSRLKIAGENINNINSRLVIIEVERANDQSPKIDYYSGDKTIDWYK